MPAHPVRPRRRALHALCLFLTLLFAMNAAALRADDLRALDGVWVYVEDLTEGRALEQMGPPMSSTFSLRTEDGAVVLVYGFGGSTPKDLRVPLDGTVTEVSGTMGMARIRATYEGGALTTEVEYVRKPGADPEGQIKREFIPTDQGLMVGVTTSYGTSLALYRHPEDIPMPTPAKATIDDLAWLPGVWSGTRGQDGAIFFEERWSPPLGGAMLATARTVSRGKMSMFEYLRIVERDGGLVYIAQPNGGKATEFIMTEFSENRAVFANPRHDYPNRIVYEKTKEGGLTATIGLMKGGAPRRFEFMPEES